MNERPSDEGSIREPGVIQSTYTVFGNGRDEDPHVRVNLSTKGIGYAAAAAAIGYAVGKLMLS